MAQRYAPYLEWIDSQRERMEKLVYEWAGVNSGTYNLKGLERLRSELIKEFSKLTSDIREVDLEPQEVVDEKGAIIQRSLGKALSLTRRPDAALRVFLGIHMDTVYDEAHPFQEVRREGEDLLRGPGVADAKGGLAVLLVALEAFERSPFASELGWEVLLNPDEEIGSPGSMALLRKAARRNHLGLVFEPALPSGNLIGERKGSGNFTIVVRGRAAHAGREFHRGHNAIHALAEIIVALNLLNDSLLVEAADPEHRATINVGRVEGGGPVNMVPDLAIARLNVRVTDAEQVRTVVEKLERIVADVAGSDGISASLHGAFPSPPKPLDSLTEELLNHLAQCGREIGVSIGWEKSGGVCDGNKLAAARLPTVDTLGVRGGNLHSSNEFLHLASLTERAKLTALLLMKLASGEIRWKQRPTKGS